MILCVLYNIDHFFISGGIFMLFSNFRLGIVFLIMMSNNAFFGMYQHNKKSIILRNKKQSQEQILPIELMIATAACASDDTKQNIRNTSKLYRNIISPYYADFIQHPLFKTSPIMINKIALWHSWYNNHDVVKKLSQRLGGSIVIPYYDKCDVYGIYRQRFSKNIAIELPGKCNKQYNIVYNYVSHSNVIIQGNDGDKYDSNIIQTVTDSRGNIHEINKSEVDLAMYCAIVCNDTNAIKNLAPKIQKLYEGVNISGKLFVYNDLMIKLIKRKNEETFEYLVEYDPYQIRSNEDTLEYTLLDSIDFERDISLKNKKNIVILHANMVKKLIKK